MLKCIFQTTIETRKDTLHGHSEYNLDTVLEEKECLHFCSTSVLHWLERKKEGETAEVPLFTTSIRTELSGL